MRDAIRSGGIFGEQAEGAAARCLIHYDFKFSGHFPKCTRQVKKGLPCRCVAKRCAGCQLPEGGQTACANPMCGTSAAGGPVPTFCDECRSNCANPATCSRYVHGVDCVECGDFSDAAVCRNCESRPIVVERAVLSVREVTDAAMASAVAAASAAFELAASSERPAMELFQKVTARMTQKIKEAAENPKVDYSAHGHEAEDADEAIAHLRAGRGISMDAAKAMEVGVRGIVEAVRAAATKTNPDASLQAASAARLATLATEIESGDRDALLSWLQESCFEPRGFLATELLRDCARQLSQQHLLDFQVPKKLTGQRAKGLIAGNLSNAPNFSLSKDHATQISAAAKAAAEEAAQDLQAATLATTAVCSQVCCRMCRAARGRLCVRLWLFPRRCLAGVSLLAHRRSGDTGRPGSTQADQAPGLCRGNVHICQCRGSVYICLCRGNVYIRENWPGFFPAWNATSVCDSGE